MPLKKESTFFLHDCSVHAVPAVFSIVCHRWRSASFRSKDFETSVQTSMRKNVDEKMNALHYQLLVSPNTTDEQIQKSRIFK